MSDVYTLAQIIAGEAQHGSDADSFGVASTIANRASVNLGGYGSDAFSQATAPSQFSAYPNALGTPNAYQLSLAEAAQNGTLSDYGNTGNALYYNGAGGSSYNTYASASGSGYGSGSNVYSDAYGKPASSNFVLPQANGTTTANAASGGASGYDFGDVVNNDASSAGGGNDPLGYSLTENNTATGSAGSADFNDVGNNIFDGSQDTTALGNDQGTPSLGGGVSMGALPTGGGAPVNITDLPGLDSAVTTGTKTVGTDTENAAGGIVGTIVSVFNKGQTYASGAVVVVGLVILGLIFVAYGLAMFKRSLP